MIKKTFYLLFVLRIVAATSAIAADKVAEKKAVPTFTVEQSIRFQKARADVADARTSAMQAQATFQQAQAVYQSVVEEATKNCGEMQPQQEADGKLICVPKPAPPPASPAK